MTLSLFGKVIWHGSIYNLSFIWCPLGGRIWGILEKSRGYRVIGKSIKGMCIHLVFSFWYEGRLTYTIWHKDFNVETHTKKTAKTLFIYISLVWTLWSMHTVCIDQKSSTLELEFLIQNFSHKTVVVRDSI